MPGRTLPQVISSNKLFRRQQRVVAGVSGGPDSMALLLLLAESALDLDCIAAYIDHGLRPDETGAERQAVEQLARTCGARFTSKTVAVREHAARHGLSIEDAARTLRYQALEEIRCEYGADVIAVAHTADDQVEEFLLRMIRGSGRKGLSGMRHRQGRVVRPLLSLRKQELTDYLVERGISFSVDSSNLDRRFLRNRIRLELLPFLEEQYNPSIRRTLLQTMDILQVEEDLLQQLAAEALPEPPHSGGERLTLPVAALRDRHPALRRRMVEETCWAMAARPSFRQIGLILHLLETAAAEAEVHLGGGLRVLKRGDALVFHYPQGRSPFRGSGGNRPVVDVEISGPGSYPVAEVGATLDIARDDAGTAAINPTSLVVDADRISFPLRLRSVAPGQRFRPSKGAGSRKISRFLNDRGIPASLRHSCLVLCCQEQVVALPGLAVDEGFRVGDSTGAVLVIDWRVDGGPSGLP